MSDERTGIEARLRQLAEADETANGGRVVARAEDGRAAVVRAILGAIDETVLPAELTLASEAPGRVTLSVAGRRLRAVRAAEGGLDAGAAADATLDAEDEGATEAAADLLGAFAASVAGAVTVAESRLDEGGAGGVSATRLAELIPAGDAPTESPPAETVAETDADRFLADLPVQIDAALVRGTSGDDRLSGDAELHEVLADMAEAASDEAAPAFVLWLQQTGPEDGAAFGRAAFRDGSLAVLCFAAADAAALARAFQDAQAA